MTDEEAFQARVRVAAKRLIDQRRDLLTVMTAVSMGRNWEPDTVLNEALKMIDKVDTHLGLKEDPPLRHDWHLPQFFTAELADVQVSCRCCGKYGVISVLKGRSGNYMDWFRVAAKLFEENDTDVCPGVG